MFVGEWLNGRVAVSKTVGPGFDPLRPCHIDVLHLQGVFLRILTEKLWNYVILRSKCIVNPPKSYRIERHCIPLMDSMALYFDGLIRYPVSTVLEPIC